MVEKSELVPANPASPSTDWFARFRGIRARLFLLTLVAMLPLLGLVVLNAKRLIAATRETAMRHYQTTAQLVASRVNDQETDAAVLLLGLGMSTSENPADRAKNTAEFREVEREFSPVIRGFFALALDGSPLGSTGDYPQLDPALRKQMDAAIAGRRLVVGRPQLTGAKARWSILLVRPLIADDGQVAGIVGVSVDLAGLAPLLEVDSLPEGSVVSLVNADRIILARSGRAEAAIGQANDENPVVSQMLASRTGSVEFATPDGAQWLAGYATCKDAPWLVSVRAPRAAALAAVTQQIRQSLLFGAAALVATLALAWLMADRLTRPIRQLAREADALGAGGQVKLKKIESRGEVGQLARTINRMLAALAQRDAELRRGEAQFRLLITGAADGIFIADAGGGLLEVNPSAAKMVGRTREELIGQAFSALVVPEETGLVAPVLARLKTGAAITSQWRFQRKDAPVFPGEVSAKQLGDGRLLCIVRDSTEREQFERKLQETQKLESLGVLAGGIAHDFNNILTGILGNASLASLEVPPATSVQDYLENIKRGSLRAAELCKQMLAYSGKGRFVVQKADLNRLVEETAHMLQISISKRAVLRFNLHQPLPAVEVDTTQIRQVIMNLVINASEAIGDKSGVISLSTGLTRVDHAYLGGTVLAADLPEGTYVNLEISDSGCGMSPETQARIFEPFFTTKFTGRGLGLAAVLGIVRGHKGALKVYSEPGRGTTFKLLFPCAAAAADAVTPVSVSWVPWRGAGRVLVVDDEESVRSTAALMLRRLGFEVALAGDGREAVEIFRAEPDRFVLVLMDLTMPHLDGAQAFAELRRLRPGVRVVLMSGFNQHEAVEQFTGKGLASFLQKPFTLEALSKVLQGVLATAPDSSPKLEV